MYQSRTEARGWRADYQEIDVAGALRLLLKFLVRILLSLIRQSNGSQVHESPHGPRKLVRAGGNPLIAYFGYVLFVWLAVRSHKSPCFPNTGCPM